MSTIPRPTVATLIAAALWAVTATAASAGGVEILVKDADGKPVADAVVSAVVVSGPRPPLRPARSSVDQVNRDFVPHVRPVVVGSDVVFPNKDDFRHHVYSFSPPKKFELALFKGTQAPPVKFDKPGVVVLGCNIHDSMLGYIVVLETPWFDTTPESGRTRLADLPAGTYDLRVWHPRLPEDAPPITRRVTVAADRDERVEVAVRLESEVRPRREPARAGKKYR